MLMGLMTHGTFANKCMYPSLATHNSPKVLGGYTSKTLQLELLTAPLPTVLWGRENSKPARKRF